MDNLSSEFLSAFNSIEDWMRHKLEVNEDDGFATLLRRLERADPQVSRHAAELKRLARLRNLIAHNHSRDRPLAVPTPTSIERAVAIATLLQSPPLLLTLAAKPVDRCTPTDPLGGCVKKMHAGVFSQLPVYDGSRYFGLLTAETIARWLAKFFIGDGTGIVDEQAVEEVMRHQEDGDNVRFLPRQATVASGIDAFDEFLSRGKRLEAILITNSGRPTESPLGIVTVHDMPKLNRAITP